MLPKLPKDHRTFTHSCRGITNSTAENRTCGVQVRSMAWRIYTNSQRKRRRWASVCLQIVYIFFFPSVLSGTRLSVSSLIDRSILRLASQGDDLTTEKGRWRRGLPTSEGLGSIRESWPHNKSRRLRTTWRWRMMSRRPFPRANSQFSYSFGNLPPTYSVSVTNGSDLSVSSCKLSSFLTVSVPPTCV